MEKTAKHIKAVEADAGVFSTVEVVTQENGTDFSLQELQGFVGGLIDIIGLPDGLIMVVNDEYLCNDTPFNPLASLMAGEGAHVRGDVLVCPDEMVK